MKLQCNIINGQFTKVVLDPKGQTLL